MKRIFPAIFLSCLGLLSMGVTHAEKADRKRPIEIKADQMQFDDVKQISTFSGTVLMQRGTMSMKAGRVYLTQDAEGYQYARLHAAPGSLAHFRQKRDGGDFWVEAKAERIEYDGKTELLKFFNRAHLQRLNGSAQSEEVAGELIIWDSRSEVFSVQHPPHAKNGTTKTVIQPRTGD